MINKDFTRPRHQDIGWRQLSVWLHIVWLCIFLFIVFIGPYSQEPIGDPPPRWTGWFAQTLPFSEISQIGQNARTLNSLDLVGLALTVLGIVLAIFALGSFTLVRSAAMDAAADEARDTMLDWLDKNRANLVDQEVISDILTEDRIMSTLANEVEKLISISWEDKIDGEAADRVAAAMDGEEVSD